VGACAREGTVGCTFDGLGTACDALAGRPAAAEWCGNEADDDCDGAVDEAGCEAERCGPHRVRPTPDAECACEAGFVDLDGRAETGCEALEWRGEGRVWDGLTASNEGDTNGDGYADVLTAADQGTLELRDGRTGAWLRSWNPGLGRVYPGRLLDVDGDGLAEATAGMPGDQDDGLAEGVVNAYSASGGFGPIQSLSGVFPGTHLGRHIADGPVRDGVRYLLAVAASAQAGRDTLDLYAQANGFQWQGRIEAPAAAVEISLECLDASLDATGDGVSDVLMGYSTGVVHLYSGADWSLAQEWEGPGWPSGRSCTWVPDADGDDLPDVLAGGFGANGSAQILSTADGSVLLDLGVAATYDVAAGPDLDGDGTDDVYLGDGASVTAHSAVTGEALWTWEPPVGLTALAPHTPSSGDCDGDGRRDLLLAAHDGAYGDGAQYLIHTGALCGSVIPATEELCDGVDNDCDGLVDEGCIARAMPLGRELSVSDDPDHPDSADRARLDQVVEVPLVAGGYLDDSVAGYWKLDGNGADATGRAPSQDVTGELVPAPGLDGRPGGAIQFDGDSWYTVGDHDRFDGFGAMTICAWVWPNEERVQSGMKVATKTGGNAAARAWYLGVSWNELTPTFGVYTTEGQGLAISRAQGVPAAWNHVCGTFGDGSLSVYLNGRLTGRTDGVPGTVNTTDTAVTIGTCGFNTCENQAFQGRIDELVLLDRALSPLEVRHAYESRAEWGTSLVPGAQADLDDLRLTEDGAEVEFEVVGGRALGGGDDAVLAYWPLDGDALGRFGDAGGATAFAGLPIDSGLVFEPTGGQSYTIEAWGRVDPFAAAQSWFGYDNGANGEISVSCVNDGSLLGAAKSAGGSSDARYDGACDDSRWHHVAMVHDATAGVVLLYRDGVEVASGDLGYGAYDAGGWSLLIGARRAGDGSATRPLHGVLDDFAIHDVARSADWIYKRAHPLPRVRFFASTEPSADASGRFPWRRYRLHWGDRGAVRSPWRRSDGLLSPRNGYLGFWRFDETAGTVVIDSSTGRHAGGLAGAATLGPPELSGAALDLGEADGGTTVNELPTFSPSQGFTIEARVRYEVPPQADATVVHRGEVPADFALDVTSGRPRFTLGAESATAPDPLAEDAWTSLAATWDGRAFVLLVGGDAVTEPTAVADVGMSDLARLRFGNYENTGPFRGAIDSVRLMHRALSPAALLGRPTRTTSGPPRPGPFHPRFEPAGPALPALGTHRPAVADWDGDGDVDLVAHREADTYTLLRNNGAGGFVASDFSPPGGGGSLASADWDGDGDLDLVYGLDGAGGAGFVIQTAPGVFDLDDARIGDEGEACQILAQLLAADLTGDGLPDLIGWSDCGIHVWRNDGGLASTRLTADPLVTGPATRLVVTDADRDGDLDVFAALQGPDTRLYLNDGDGGLVPAGDDFSVQGTGATVDLIAADLDGDGDEDLALLRETGATDRALKVLYNVDGHYATAHRSVRRHSSRMAFLTAGDLDADGDLDLVAASAEGEPATVLYNDGRGRFVAGPELGASTGYVPLLDLDGDRDLDALVIDDAGTTPLITEREPRGPELMDWTSARTLGDAAAGGSLVALNGHLYALGGKNDTPSDAAFVATPAADGSVPDWTPTLAPGELVNASALAYRGAIYLAGGRGRTSVYVAVPAADGSIAAWAPTTDLLVPRERFGLAGWDGRLYVVGGNDGQGGSPYASVHHAAVAADHTVGVWLESRDLPAPRHDAGVVVHDGWLWVVGGRETDQRTQRDTVFAAPILPDGALGEWTQPASLAAAAYGQAAVVRGDRLYVFGGATHAGGLDSVLSTRLLADGQLGAWASEAPLSARRAYLGLAVLDGTVHALGGSSTGTAGGNRDWAARVPIRP